jgi:predicted component of type VI protein secretion system
LTFYLDIWTQDGREPIALVGERMTLGRAEGNDIRVEDDKVSRSHAVLERVGTTWCIRDLSSSNGTFVNGTRVSAERPLEPNVEIRVGRTRIVFRAKRPTNERRTLTEGGSPMPSLTPREFDVLRTLCAPLLSNDPYPEPATTKEIAASLVVSEAAVRQHLLRLYDKFGIPEDEQHKRSHLAKQALLLGAVGPDRS